jgi:hypothetical protein
MRYAIYFTWKDDNTSDSIIVKGVEERNLNIKDMVKRNEFKDIYYCKIYSSGEYGKHIKVGKNCCNFDNRF